MIPIALLTDPRYVAESDSAYVQNIFREDRLLQEALFAEGIQAHRISWDDPALFRHEWHALVFRTTWDYFERFEEFQAWLAEVSRRYRLINSPAVLRWNLDKNYLHDLQRAGLAIPPTLFIQPDDAATGLDQALAQNWENWILKPAVSGAARLTFRLRRWELESEFEKWRQLLSTEAFLIQEFQASVLRDGELSLMFFGGTFSHAIQKKAREGDFRVQDDFGGTVHPYRAGEAEIQVAQKAVQFPGAEPVYARVDLIRSQNGFPVIQELELIEPELWMRFHPPAAQSFARAIRKACTRK